MSLINWTISLMLTWSANCVLLFNAAANQATTFEITDTKPYVPVVTLSIQDNAKLLKQLKSGFKRIINWNKYQSKTSVQTQNQYLDHLVDPSYQGANRLFVTSNENDAYRTNHKRYFLSTVEINYYNMMIDRRNFFGSIYQRKH